MWAISRTAWPTAATPNTRCSSAIFSASPRPWSTPRATTTGSIASAAVTTRWRGWPPCAGASSPRPARSASGPSPCSVRPTRCRASAPMSRTCAGPTAAWCLPLSTPSGRTTASTRRAPRCGPKPRPAKPPTRPGSRRRLRWRASSRPARWCWPPRPRPWSTRTPAQPRLGQVHPGFGASVERTLLPLAEAAPFPVLLIHGDAHHHIVDRPFRNPKGQPIANLWRLEVFGEPRVHAVRVRVQVQAGPAGDVSAAPFGFSPVWNPLSPDPRMPRRSEP